MRSTSTGSPGCAIILAGGLGLRLRAAVPDLPKPLSPLKGRPFLAHLMDYWCDQGVTRFILSVGYMREKIIAAFGSEYRGVPVDYAIEETPLGTGGGLLQAMQKLPDAAPFLLLNGDTFFTVQGSDLLKFHHQHQAQCSLSLFRSGEAGRYMAVRLGDDDRITALSDGEAEIGGFANGGVYVLDPAAFKNFALGTPLSFERDILPQLHEQGAAIYGMACDGRFIDIGVPSDYARAADIILRN